MPGLNQLPSGAEGAAAVSLTYSSVSFICSSLMIWLAWVHDEKWNFLSLTAHFTLLGTTMSIIQQIHDITWWTDIMVTQWDTRRTFQNDPEIATANGSYGLDLVLYYIQYYSYNVEALMIMFMALELVQSVYGWNRKTKLAASLKRLNTGAKTVAVLFPLITILSLRAPAVQQTFVVFILLADLPLMLSLMVGATLMVATLARYVQSRKKVTQWTPPGAGGTGDESITTSHTGSTKITKYRGVYDRWLIVRFICAFVALTVFEITNVIFQVASISNNYKDIALGHPDLSADRARATLFLFMPGVTPAVFLFIIFGTATGYRKKMYETFVPKRWRKKLELRRRLRNQTVYPSRTSAVHNLSTIPTSVNARGPRIQLEKPLPLLPPDPVRPPPRAVEDTLYVVRIFRGEDDGQADGDESRMYSSTSDSDSTDSKTDSHVDVSSTGEGSRAQDSDPILPIMSQSTEENNTK